MAGRKEAIRLINEVASSAKEMLALLDGNSNKSSGLSINIDPGNLSEVNKEVNELNNNIKDLEKTLSKKRKSTSSLRDL